jgi:hypothetical protein
MKTKHMRRIKPTNYQPLLSIESDPKTVKGSKKGFLTGIVYLAPHKLSGVINTCGFASEGCIQGCLNLSGLGGVFNSIQLARIAKTHFMVADYNAFLASLAYDIETLRIKARARRLKPAVRINGTSDIPKIARAMAQRFTDVQFYDYTKIPQPWKRTLPNYSLTFSHSEVNHQECIDALNHGINVAVVFGVKKTQPLPETWGGFPVLNGDESDLRFADKGKGVVIGLYAKGPAKKDCSGFVVRPNLVQIGGSK